MRRKPSRPSRKKPPPVWEPARGDDLGRVLRKHPEIKAMLRVLKLKIEEDSGRLFGRHLWLCP